MVRFILGLFTTEQKIEAILTHPIIEFIFIVLLVTFALAMVMHLALYSYIRPLRNHLKRTGRMDMVPLDHFQEDFAKERKAGSVPVETFVQEKFSQWRYLGVPIVHLIKMIQATVSVFILLGVLGTFIGLTISLGSLSTASDQFVENAASVLSGIDVAFYTSIMGMGFSLLMTLLIHLLNTEFILTDLMLMVETSLTEENKQGMGKLIDVSTSIHQAVLDSSEANQSSLHEVIQSFTGFQEYTIGLEQSAKDLKAFNEGLSQNLIEFQQLFLSMEEVTAEIGTGTDTLNENFSQLFSYMEQAEEKRTKDIEMIESIHGQIFTTASLQKETSESFTEFLDDIETFLTNGLSEQAKIQQSFTLVVEKSEQLVKTMEGHHQEFKKVFGQNIGDGLKEIEVHLDQLANDFDQLGTTFTDLPVVLTAINDTQDEYRQLLANRFRDMDTFNQSFGNYLRELAKESTQMEKNIREAAGTFEQVSHQNHQSLQEINQSLTQIDQAFSQRDNQFDRNNELSRDLLTDMMRKMTDTLDHRLDQMTRQVDDVMRRTGEDIQREFSDLQRMQEEALQTNMRLLHQLVQEVSREMQGLHRQIHQRQLSQQGGLKPNEF